jgi:23S rRNA (cytosine1962-C5)-methyltransferase
MAKICIKSQHVPPLRAGHPWVFAQAVDRVEGNPGVGDVVDVTDVEGHFIGRGFYSKGSSIPVRLLVTRPEQKLDFALLRSRIDEAKRLRADLGLPSEATTGYRLVNAEGDAMSGLTVDVVGEAVVLRFHTAGMARRAQAICDILAELLRPKAIYEAKGDESQAREGLAPQPTGVQLRGAGGPLWSFRENGLELSAELPSGQKTGFYFDQRENRARVAALAPGRRVLDLYCYTGGFSLAAARAGASEVLGVDSSAVALLAAEQHKTRNDLGGKVRFVRADARKFLEQIYHQARGSLGLGELFDLVVLDPPKLMTSQKSRDQARRAYRMLNAAALRAVTPGGLLATCSCSGRQGLDEFLRMLGLASVDAGRTTTVLEVRGAGPDHPSPPAFDQGRYLKFVLLKVES